MTSKKKQPEQATAAMAEQEAPKEEVSLLDNIIEESGAFRTEEEQSYGKDIIGELVTQVMDGTVKVSKDVIASIDARIAEIDALMSEQLNEIMHAEEFQNLEASWRGLHYLVDQTETSTTLKIRILNASKKDLLNDFKGASEFDQSAFFKSVYGAEYDMFGGSPYGAVIGDFEFTNHPQDLFLLDQVSHVAAASHAPFLTAASPELFGWDNYTELMKPRDLAKIFDSTKYTKFNSLRASEDARYLGLTLPHVLGRLPYGAENVPVDAFNYEEDVDGKEHKKYLWTNAAYALGARLTDAFAKYGWCAAIRGVEGGGLVEGLPTHTFKTDAGDIALKCPTEIAIGERRDRELSDLGFISLVHCKDTDYAAFFATQSLQKQKKYNTDEANANARLSTQLQYIFATSRIAHYLKAMMRDKIGSFASRKNVDDFLNTWLAQYVLADDSAGQEAKAKFPLRAARAEVTEVAGKPGAYKAVAFLRPHFQLDELTASLRLVADLPQSARR